MKILEINKFNYVQGGSDRHFQDLLGLLKSKGNEVAVFSMESPQNEFSPWKKYFVSYVGYGKGDTLWQKTVGVARMFYSFEAKRKIGKLLEDFQPDIVHIHNIYHQISPSILGEIKKRHIPIIMTVHDYKLICPNYLLQCDGGNWEEWGKDRYLNFVRNKCFKNSYLKSFLVMLEFRWHEYQDVYDKNIDGYIVPSQFAKNKLLHAGFAENKINVLPHFAKESGCVEVAKFELPEKYLLYFGWLSREKGVDRLIEMAGDLPGVKLYLAGKMEEDLEKIIEKSDSTNIKHLGFLQASELERYIRNSLFVVSPSRLPETFGLIALEAIKNGKPFIGFDAGAYGEVIRNNEDGYICQTEEEMREKIKQLAADPGLRILFSRNALQRAKEFDKDKYYTKINGIFQQYSKK